MSFLFQRNFTLIFIVIAVLVSFWFGSMYGNSQVVCRACQPEELDFSLFWEAWHLLEDNHVNDDGFNAQKMIYGAISGMVKSLEDPYTIFLEPEEAKRFVDDIKGSFEGVGMEIGIRKGQLQIIAPLEGTPAQKAGLRAGDKIIMIDELLTIDITIDEAVNLIRGPKGTEVALTIYRDDWDETKEITITRGVIEIPVLKLEFKEDNIAYLKLYHFSESASYEFKEAAIDILDSSADKIILDLRNNPGGYLEVAQDITSWFLEKGEVITIEDFGSGEEQKLYKANGNTKLMPYKVVILINQGSASASEILAGALRDNRGIKLIGETSFGKGSVQQLESLADGSSLKITIARWLTPNGEHIAEIGLSPDIEVELTEEDFNEGLDPQLDKAIEVVTNLK